MTLATWLARTAHAHPDLPATAVGPETSARYRDLARRAGSIARMLRRWGVARRQPVAIYSGGAPEYFEALFGCWWGGFVAAPIEPGFQGAQLIDALALTGAKVCFADRALAGRIIERAPRGLLERLVVFGGSEWRSAADGEPAALAEFARSAPAMLYFGAAPEIGAPLRAAQFSHSNLMNLSLALLADVDQLAPRDAQIHAAPVALQSGLCALPTVARGGVNVTPPSGGVDAAEIFEIAQQWRRASIFTTPPLLAELTRSDTECDVTAFRSIWFGGAPAARRDVAAALDRFGPRLAQVYGVKEMPLSLTRLSRYDIAARTDPSWLPRIGTIGRSFMLTELRVVGANGRPAAPGRAGRIQARGPMRMAGYWRDAAATEAALDGQWLRTGLVGSMDVGGWITLKNPPGDDGPSAPGPVMGRPRAPYLLDGETALRDAMPDVVELALVRPETPEIAPEIDFHLFFVGRVPEDEALKRAAAVAERVGRVGSAHRCEALPRDAEGRLRLAPLRAMLKARGAAQGAGDSGSGDFAG